VMCHEARRVSTIGEYARKEDARCSSGVRGKVALAARRRRGIGVSCARAFLVKGASVAIASGNTENLEAARRS
jgi:hypothetical protein